MLCSKPHDQKGFNGKSFSNQITRKQESLVEIAARHKIKLNLFHGRGGCALIVKSL